MYEKVNYIIADLSDAAESLQKVNRRRIVNDNFELLRYIAQFNNDDYGGFGPVSD